MRRVHRPKAGKKKIHSKDEFELCYLRHQYFRRVKYNPTQQQMKPFMAIASHLARNTFFTYRNLFQLVGFESEDLINIANVHLVSFLGLFSLESMPEKYKDFVKTFKDLCGEKPQERDILDKNQANFTLFLKQRMEDVVRVCRQKARNIKGMPVEEYYYYYGPNKPPKRYRDLLKNHEKYGFRKLDGGIYKSIRKKLGLIHGLSFIFGGNFYVAVPLEKRSMTIDDFSGADMNPYDSLHNMNPEEVYFTLEDNELWEKRREEFSSKSPSAKAKMIRKFIRMNNDNPEYEKEIALAKRILKDLN